MQGNFAWVPDGMLLAAATLGAGAGAGAPANAAEASAPQQHCPPPPAIWSPPDWAACAHSLTQRPHIDYGDVIALPDVTFSVLPDFRPLKMTLYVPKRGAGPFPIVVYVHGGAWKLDPEGREDPSGTESMVRLAARGYVVVVPGYRTSVEAIFPAQLIDVKTAIRYAKTYAAVYRGDAARVAIWGASAGGNLAALAATTCGRKDFEQVPPPPPGVPVLPTPYIDPALTSCVLAAIDWFGHTDFAQLDAQRDSQPGGRAHGAPASPESDYVGCPVANCPAERLQAANPMTYITADTPPVLIMHGLADHRVPWQQSQEFYDALVARGVTARLVLVPAADHLFEGISAQLQQQQVDMVFAWIAQYTRK